MKLISVKGTNIDLTDAIKAYLEDKLEPVDKLVQDFEPVAELLIDVGKESHHHNKGPYFYAEFTMHIPGDVLRAREKETDLYAAIDLARDQLSRQIKDFKEKLTDANRQPRPDKEWMTKGWQEEHAD